MFWAYAGSGAGSKHPMSMTRLVCLGFAKGSLRKFEVLDVADVVDACFADKVEGYPQQQAEEEEEDEKGDEWPLKVHVRAAAGVSNAVPLGHMDAARLLLLVSSVGVFEVKESAKEMGLGAAFQAKGWICAYCVWVSDWVYCTRGLL